MGSYIWLQGRIELAGQAASLRIKKAIPVEDQILWKFSTSDSQTKLRWEHSREFEYKGEMYDIIRFDQRGDTVLYWCYWDREETRLKKRLNFLVVRMMGPAPQSNNEGRQLTEFFRSLYFPFEKDNNLIVGFSIEEKELRPYLFALLSSYIIPPSPPPEWS
jgi:hypothetical protein